MKQLINPFAMARDIRDLNEDLDSVKQNLSDPSLSDTARKKLSDRGASITSDLKDLTPDLADAIEVMVPALRVAYQQVILKGWAIATGRDDKDRQFYCVHCKRAAKFIVHIEHDDGCPVLVLNNLLEKIDLD